MKPTSRRQFLADALFAGGGLAAAALLARSFTGVEPTVAQAPTPSSTPSATPSPAHSCAPSPDMPYPGEMVAAPPVEGKVAPATPAPKPDAR